MITNPTTLARRTDLATSKLAARKVATKSMMVRAAIYDLLTDHGPMTHDELATQLLQNHPDLPATSPSSIRTRTAELARAGLVAAVGIGLSRMGNPASLWAAIPAPTASAEGK